MIPVFQDKFYEPGVEEAKQRGNCWTAAIASLLELPLHEVPNFVEIDVNGGPDWYMSTIEFLEDRGYTLFRTFKGANPNWPRPEPDEYYMVSGVSPRGNGEIYHVVIFQNDEMVHDPHPDGTGILTEEDIHLVRLI